MASLRMCNANIRNGKGQKTKGHPNQFTHVYRCDVIFKSKVNLMYLHNLHLLYLPHPYAHAITSILTGSRALYLVNIKNKTNKNKIPTESVVLIFQLMLLGKRVFFFHATPPHLAHLQIYYSSVH